MISVKIRSFLDANQVKYVTIDHSPAYTAQEIAASAHIPGKDLAKTVIVKIDGKPAMVVLPASRRVSVSAVQDLTGTRNVMIASEDEFAPLFPDCYEGAMPPFGNLYGLEVYVDAELTKDEIIVFNACSHTELIAMRYADFERLVHPKVLTAA